MSYFFIKPNRYFHIDLYRFVELEDSAVILRQLVFYVKKSGFAPADLQSVCVL